MPANVKDFAQVLLFMKERGMLQHPHFKRVIGVLVRDAMETPLPHCTTDYRSRMAQEEIMRVAPQSPSQYNKGCNTLRHEHMVPTSVRMKILAQMQNPTEESIAQTLRTFGLRATLHVDEDNKLNRAGFNSKMPVSFWDPENKQMFMNPLARYIETGLIHNLVPREGHCWFADDSNRGLYTEL